MAFQRDYRNWSDITPYDQYYDGERGYGMAPGLGQQRFYNMYPDNNSEVPNKNRFYPAWNVHYSGMGRDSYMEDNRESGYHPRESQHLYDHNARNGTENGQWKRYKDSDTTEPWYSSNQYYAYTNEHDKKKNRKRNKHSDTSSQHRTDGDDGLDWENGYDDTRGIRNQRLKQNDVYLRTAKYETQNTSEDFDAQSYSHPVDTEPVENNISKEMRAGIPEPHGRGKRRKSWNIIKRIISIILLIVEIVFDWLEYTDIVDIEKEVKNALNVDDADQCTNVKKYEDYYLYFTIAGTVLAVLQIINISYQIHCERKPENEKVWKILDGRTEVFITYIFEEIPQIYLLARIETSCVSLCNRSLLEYRKIISMGNRSITFFSQSWRSLTSFTLCERETNYKPVTKSNKSSSCLECILCCCFPWLFTIRWILNCFLAIFGKRFTCKVCCQPVCKHKETSFDFCFCILTWCPDPDTDHRWLELNPWFKNLIIGCAKCFVKCYESCKSCCCFKSCRTANPDDLNVEDLDEPCCLVVFFSQLLNILYAFLYVLTMITLVDCTANFILSFILRLIGI